MPVLRSGLEISALLLVSLLVAAIGNSVVERRIDFDRDYFAHQKPRVPPAVVPADRTPVATPTPEKGAEDDGTGETASSRIVIDANGVPRINGYQVAMFDDVLGYMDLGEDLTVVCDARKKDLYVEGHIPGAYFFDYYQMHDLIEDLREKLDPADFIVIYCNGGDCEDSLGLAHELEFTYNFDNYKLWVYEGGYKEWEKNGQPVVTGEERK